MSIAKDFPVLTTDRLTLRCVRLSDAPQLMEYCNDDDVSNNLISLPRPYLEEHVVAWMNNIYEGFRSGQHYVYVIATKETDELLGAIGLHLQNPHQKAELGYWIGAPHRNQGYISEAIGAVIEFGFNQLQLNKIFALHFVDNPASGQVLKKNGMHQESKMKDHYGRRKGSGDVIQYALFKDAYLLQ